MKEIAIEDLLKSATDPKVIGDGSIFETLKEMNRIATECDKILGIAEKYNLLNPIRLYFIKKNELDKVKDISSTPNGIVPASEVHKIAFLELNNIPEETLKKQLEIMKAQKESKNVDRTSSKV